MIFTGPVAQKRFKSLREKYCREKRRQPPASLNDKWIFSESLKFLDPFIAARSTSSKDLFGGESARDHTTEYDAFNSAIVSPTTVQPISEASFDQFDDEESGASTQTTGANVSEEDIESIAATSTPLANTRKRSTTTTNQPVTMPLLKEKLNARINECIPKNKQSDYFPFLSFLIDQLDYMTPDQLLMAKKQILDVTFRILKDT